MVLPGSTYKEVINWLSRNCQPSPDTVGHIHPSNQQAPTGLDDKNP